MEPGEKGVANHGADKLQGVIKDTGPTWLEWDLGNITSDKANRVLSGQHLCLKGGFGDHWAGVVNADKIQVTVTEPPAHLQQRCAGGTTQVVNYIAGPGKFFKQSGHHVDYLLVARHGSAQHVVKDFSHFGIKGEICRFLFVFVENVFTHGGIGVKFLRKNIYTAQPFFCYNFFETAGNRQHKNELLVAVLFGYSIQAIFRGDMKKNTINSAIFLGLVVFSGTCLAVGSQGGESLSPAGEKSAGRSKRVIEEEAAMAVVPGSMIEAEKVKKIKQSTKIVPGEQEKKAKIPK